MCERMFRSPSSVALLDAVFDAVRTQLHMVGAGVQAEAHANSRAISAVPGCRLTWHLLCASSCGQWSRPRSKRHRCGCNHLMNSCSAAVSASAGAGTWCRVLVLTSTLGWQVRRALQMDTGALEVYDLAFEAGVAMETLAELVAAPLFYQRCGLEVSAVGL